MSKNKQAETALTPRKHRMHDGQLVHYMGEAIRKAITGEHLPYIAPFGFSVSYGPDSDLVCTCKPDRIVNTCPHKILERAFQVYADNYPERFPVF